MSKKLPPFDLDLEFVLNSLTTGIFICDSDLYVRFMNQAYADYLGFTRDQIVGRRITDFIPDSRAPQVIEHGKPELGNICRVKGKDCERCIVVNRIPFKTGDGSTGMISQALFNSHEELGETHKRLEDLDKKISVYAKKIKSALSSRYSLQSIIGESETIRRYKNMLSRFARTGSPVLILGPTGVGKELTAGALHCESDRREGPFVCINCAAIPKELFESELFGYSPGAFSGAHKDGKVGQLELADNGTLFLDEIGDTPLAVQSKLLRVLENGSFCRVGSTKQRSANFRLVAATNRDLKGMMSEGHFREDLYYRISPLILNVPPLNQRREDIPLLTRHLLERMNRTEVRITETAMQALMAYSWPGNVRELRNILIRALSLCNHDTIGAADLPLDIRNERSAAQLEWGLNAEAAATRQVESPREPGGSQQSDLARNIAESEAHLITRALEEQRWNVTKAAKYLCISRATLYEKMKKHGIAKK
ncbi:MAG: hypothetical protein BCS36_12130 [Desulfovibrio sp. MES5]|uniref:sigma-54 interaction domain-containing protein n=1 Tax=Desulfovibrio sp. MES5 TaxID=1899016 RepID=UPI000B9D0BC3|nr:sigma 54-interacting transcriptional regulator [Desulfovibrio sp. MES5]OXS29162.1 MAG: hypothetical protein BCS36_12130 [Desulfovibrio sp. MES5]